MFVEHCNKNNINVFIVCVVNLYFLTHFNPRFAYQMYAIRIQILKPMLENSNLFNIRNFT